MFVAFPLYIIHAVLTGLSLAIAYLLDIHLGFSFSAGLIDLLLYGTAPAAKNIPLLLVMGVVFFVVYYLMFRFAIKKWNMRTPGREDEAEFEAEQHANLDRRRRPRPAVGAAGRGGDRAADRPGRGGRRQQGRAADRRVRRPGEPGQRRRLHHPAADGGRRQGQGRPGPAQGARRRRGDRGRQQRPGRLRHPGRGAEEPDQRRAERRPPPAAASAADASTAPTAEPTARPSS